MTAAEIVADLNKQFFVGRVTDNGTECYTRVCWIDDAQTGPCSLGPPQEMAEIHRARLSDEDFVILKNEY